MVTVGPYRGAPWLDGDAVMLVWGAQAGLHADLALTTTGLDSDHYDIQVSWSDGEQLWDGASRTVACDGSGCTRQCTFFRSILMGRASLEDACGLVQRPLTLSVEIGDQERWAHQTIALVADVYGPSFNDPCP